MFKLLFALTVNQRWCFESTLLVFQYFSMSYALILIIILSAPEMGHTINITRALNSLNK